MAISFSRLLSAIPILLLHSYGVSIALITQVLLLVIPSYSQALSNISTLMAAKMGKTSLECSIKVTGLSSGFSTSLEPILAAILIVLQGDLLTVKKSLWLNIKILMSPQSTREL
jgi:hypothetical protein